MVAVAPPMIVLLLDLYATVGATPKCLVMLNIMYAVMSLMDLQDTAKKRDLDIAMTGHSLTRNKRVVAE